MRKRDCFAFRTNGKIDECDALNAIHCEVCPFYKPADTLEYYERRCNGVKVHGYNEKDGGKLARLLTQRAELDAKIKAITG